MKTKTVTPTQKWQAAIEGRRSQAQRSGRASGSKSTAKTSRK